MTLLGTISIAASALQDAEAAPAFVGPDVAWMLVATALVLLMTPALGFFYGGLVRSKNILNTLMMSFAALGVVGVVWALVAYSLAFSPGNPFIGGLDFALLNNVGLDGKDGASIPHILFMAYQGTFAIITAALISGAIVERMKFGPYLAFIAIWTVAVYAPIAHWVWASTGWIFGLGAMDFAGGTVVHVNAGVAAVVAAIIVGSRKDYGRQALLPHNVTYVLLGAGLLWFGWFGFNGGSALAANRLASLAFVNTMLAPAGTLVVWMLIETFRNKTATAVGAATAIVVGLVAITPAAGYISPLNSIVLGAIAAFPSYFMIQLRSRSRLDDSLDVFAAHGTGGMVGALLTGVFAQTIWSEGYGGDGALYGNPRAVLIQAIAILGAGLYSGVVTAIILKAISFVTPLRRPDREEGRGLDIILHGEEGYASGDGAVLVLQDTHSKKPGAPAPTSFGSPTPLKEKV